MCVPGVITAGSSPPFFKKRSISLNLFEYPETCVNGVGSTSKATLRFGASSNFGRLRKARVEEARSQKGKALERIVDLRSRAHAAGVRPSGAPHWSAWSRAFDLGSVPCLKMRWTLSMVYNNGLEEFESESRI